MQNVEFKMVNVMKKYKQRSYSFRVRTKEREFIKDSSNVKDKYELYNDYKSSLLQRDLDDNEIEILLQSLKIELGI